MAKRTSPSDINRVSVASDLEEVVEDKRAGWRASGAKARRRQRRYKNLLTQQILRMDPGMTATGDEDEADDPDLDMR